MKFITRKLEVQKYFKVEFLLIYSTSILIENSITYIGSIASLFLYLAHSCGTASVINSFLDGGVRTSRNGLVHHKQTNAGECLIAHDVTSRLPSTSFRMPFIHCTNWEAAFLHSLHMQVAPLILFQQTPSNTTIPAFCNRERTRSTGLSWREV